MKRRSKDDHKWGHQPLTESQATDCIKEIVNAMVFATEKNHKWFHQEGKDWLHCPIDSCMIVFITLSGWGFVKKKAIAEHYRWREKEERKVKPSGDKK